MRVCGLALGTVWRPREGRQAISWWGWAWRGFQSIWEEQWRRSRRRGAQPDQCTGGVCSEIRGDCNLELPESISEAKAASLLSLLSRLKTNSNIPPSKTYLMSNFTLT